MNNKYELLYIIRAGESDANREKSIQKYVDIVEKSGGTITMIDKWGNRRLAYPINYKNEGYYVLMYFFARANVPAEIERIMNISEDIVRFMIVNRFDLPDPQPRRKREYTDKSSSVAKEDTPLEGGGKDNSADGGQRKKYHASKGDASVKEETAAKDIPNNEESPSQENAGAVVSQDTAISNA